MSSVEDIHRHIASIMFGVKIEDATPAQVWEAKELNCPYMTEKDFYEPHHLPQMEARAREFAWRQAQGAHRRINTSISTLSARSLKVLSALQSAAEENGGDFGFFDVAYEFIKDDFSSHQFAGHIADLTKRGLIAWTEDLGNYEGIDTVGIQFGLAEFTA